MKINVNKEANMNATQQVIPIPLGHVMAFLIKGKRSILVDTGVPGSEQKILSALAANGVAPKDISLILITHCHSDHFGSLPALKEQIGAKVAIQKSEAEALTQGVSVAVVPAGILGHIFKLFITLSRNPKIAGVKPDILVDRELSLEEFGVQGKVIATPGHTAGSVSVILASGEALIGDLLMAFRKGALKYPVFAQNLEQVTKSLKLVMDHAPNKIYASHGGMVAAEVVLKKFEQDLKGGETR
jgi:hydroxyacylglutathione hydrolase